jgi:cytochrome c
MIISRVSAWLATAASMAACSGPGSGGDVVPVTDEADVLTAATLGAQVVLPTADYLKLPQYQGADSEHGARLVMQCRACHSVEKDGATIIGPNLHGFFGRPVGDVDGYPYSPALTEADFIWTPRALDAWLAEPARFLPGNRMVYPGLANADDRSAVIAALLRLTDDSAGAAGG